jgi:hypothetical protein
LIPYADRSGDCLCESSGTKPNEGGISEMGTEYGTSGSDVTLVSGKR